MSRFYQGYPWRWVVLAVDSFIAPELRVVSFLDPLAIDATVTRTLNEPLTISLTVPSEYAQVNLEDAVSGDPLVAEGNRVLVGMRPERSDSTHVWVPRAAGVLLQPEDAADSASGAGNAYTTCLALDPWNNLYKRPVVYEDGTLPSSDLGLRFPAGTAPDQIVLALLANTAAAHGPTMIEATGTIEALDPIPEAVVFERGLTVGEAWKQLCDADYCDIVLDPILELGAGTIARLNVYARAGEPRYDARFSWDAVGASLASVNRQENGTDRTNKVLEFNGQGGPPVPLRTSYLSVAKYGQSWLVKAQERTTTRDVAVALAEGDLAARKDGVKTINVSPLPERCPVPFTGYDIGDTVPVLSMRGQLRAPVDGLWRVTSIPVHLAPGEPERVEQLSVTSDEDTGS